MSLTTPEINQGHNNIRSATPSHHILTLPTEIRLMIYEYIFANETVSVTKSPQFWRPPKNQGALYPLLVCWQIRKEAIPVFYTLVTFDLSYNADALATLSVLDPGVRQNIKSMIFNSMMVALIAGRFREGNLPYMAVERLLPSLERVYVSDSSRLLELDPHRKLAIEALRLYLGHDNLRVDIERHPEYHT